MKRDDTPSTQIEDRKPKVHAARFAPALDSRKRKIRGLWMRNGRFYAQMRIRVASGSSKAVRIPLDAATLDLAKIEAEKRRTEKQEGSLHLPGHRPKFSELVEDYKKSAAFLAKKTGTQENEKQALNRWIEHSGGTRIDWITADVVTTFHDKRRADGVTSRTINLDTTAFNNCMRYAAERKWLTTAPKVKRLKEASPLRRPLLTRAQVASILKHAKVTKNAAQFRLYVRFLVATGAREQEALKIRRADVDMVRGVVHIGADGDTKSGKGRDIQFNDSLRSVLSDLTRLLPKDSTWLFPSPQRGKKDIHAKTFRESLRLVRSAAALPGVGFHDFRHYFASACVMAGLDYMTIAKWLGHQDGGILVARVYGHLNDDHQRAAADKLSKAKGGL